MSGTRFLSTRTKLMMIISQALGYASCIIAIILKYIGHYYEGSYIFLGILLPVIILFINYFMIFNSFVDKKREAMLYVLTTTASLLIVLFIVTAFIAR